jgi:hypothetical protein
MMEKDPLQTALEASLRNLLKDDYDRMVQYEPGRYSISASAPQVRSAAVVRSVAAGGTVTVSLSLT